MLRKTFSVPGPVRRAIWYASALGLYELRLNGRRVGEALLSPEWTDYHQKVQYQGYDVTALLHPGENALGALLGAGWYAGRIGMAENFAGGWRGLYGRRLALIAQLRVELENGERLVLATDSTWKSTDRGPIRSADLLDGEVYDARLEMPGWDAPGFDDSSWEKAAVTRGPSLVAQPNEPIRITRTLQPVTVTEPCPGVFIFDLGQNMVGWPRMSLHAAAGIEIRFRYGEMLHPDGTLYRDNLRGAPQIDRYICRGEGNEIFEPHFTYHGFRYIEVAGLPYQPSLDDLTGCVLHSAAPEVGQFACSSELLNKIMAAIQWTQRSNLHSTPTDCPQRDERLGWMGDAQVFAQTAIFNMDMAAFFTKWTRDIREAQASDGRFPDFAPHPFDPNQRFSGNPGWGDAGVLVPWLLYVNYADADLLEEQLEAAQRYVDWFVANNPDLIWREASQLTPLWYGDWLNADTFADLAGLPRKGGEVGKEIYSTAFLAHSAQRVSQIADVIGRKKDAARYRRLATKVRTAFNRAFVSKDGRIQGDTQAGYALALNFDLLPARLRPLAARRMVEALTPYDGGLSTGIQSTVRLMIELSRYGYHDAAYTLMMKTSIPSWGYMVEHGGTTIWERWDGWVEGRGFQDPGMNSFNHYAIGAVGEWMYRVIGGLNPDPAAPGWKRFIIHPIPGGGLSWAQASYDSIRGRIRCRWEVSETALAVMVEIPANTSATVFIPAGEDSQVTESGQPAEKSPGVTAQGRRDGCAVFRVSSGSYEFRASLHPVDRLKRQ
jgi:alpha-L-rhamnosidase